MIQLIRRFLNSENTPLNRILRTGLEEVSNKMGRSDGKTLFDAIGSLNTNLNKPLNELITEKINSVLSKMTYLDNSYMSNSNTDLLTTLLDKTISGGTYASGEYKYVITKPFIVPKSGIYYFKVTVKTTGTNGVQGDIFSLKNTDLVYKSNFVNNILSASEGAVVSTKNLGSIVFSNNNKETEPQNTNVTKEVYVYLEKFDHVIVGVSTYSGKASMSSVKIYGVEKEVP